MLVTQDNWVFFFICDASCLLEKGSRQSEASDDKYKLPVKKGGDCTSKFPLISPAFMCPSPCPCPCPCLGEEMVNE